MSNSHSHAALRNALDAVQHLGDANPPWQEMLVQGLRMIGGDVSNFLLFDRHGSVLSVHSHNMSALASQEYTSHFYAHDIVTPHTLGHTQGQWFDSSELYTSAQLSRSGYFVDYLNRHGARQAMAHMVITNDNVRGGITILRERPLSDARRKLESSSVRTFTQALRQAIHARETDAQRWMAQAEAGLDAFGETLCLVSPEGTPIRCSAHSQRVLESCGLLRGSGSRLRHADADTQHRLTRALQRVAMGDSPARLSLSLAMYGPTHVDLATAPPALSTGGERLVLLRLMHLPRAPAPATASGTAEALRMAFDITPAEARVLAALIAGQSAKQHALAQRLSVHTVRSQIASLMSKMGCARQVDLVRLALRVSTSH